MMLLESNNIFNQLAANKVISFHPTGVVTDSVYKRILWMSPEEERIILIDINKVNALPEEADISDLLHLYDEGLITICDYYEKAKYIIREDCIPQSSKQKRDCAWSMIKDLVIKEPEIYNSNMRGKLIETCVKNYGASKKSIYKYLRRYWQYGKINNALLPNYTQCGGKGKEKKEGTIKRGRNKKYDLNPKNGINISDKDKKEFYRAVKDFYNTSDKLPLKYAYEKMLFRQYIIGYIDENEIPIPVLKPLSLLPTFDQFKYWCEKVNDIKTIIISREGEKVFELKHRPVLGKSTAQAFGPGSRYQIDATIADVYLVNSLTRDKVLKRVTIYAVMDVFSRIVTGSYVGLEGPSWIGAAMAIANAGMDKVQFCKNFGISITKEQWPCEFMPELITADRGELEGNGPVNLINTLGVDIEILPPYRADWKGIIEYEFRRLNLAAILWLPGSIKKQFRERGEKDYRLDAALTLKELTAIIIRCVLMHNNNHRMSWYDRDEFQISNKVSPVPIDLWNWGMKNRTGSLRKYPEDILKLNLMPSCEATLTYKGIKIGKYHYTSETAIKENWFIKARMYGSWKISMSYDPRNMEHAYIRLNNGRDYEKCYLLDSSSTFRNCYYEEVQEYTSDDKRDQYNYRYEELQAKAETDAYINNIVQDGISLTQESNSCTSDRQKILQITQSTKTEKELNRKEETFILKDKHSDEPSSQESIPYTLNQNEDVYIPPVRYE